MRRVMNSNSFLSDKCIASDIFNVGGQRAIILRSHQVKNSWDLESLARFYQRSAKDVHTSMGGCMGWHFTLATRCAWSIVIIRVNIIINPRGYHSYWTMEWKPCMVQEIYQNLLEGLSWEPHMGTAWINWWMIWSHFMAIFFWSPNPCWKSFYPASWSAAPRAASRARSSL